MPHSCIHTYIHTYTRSSISGISEHLQLAIAARERNAGYQPKLGADRAKAKKEDSIEEMLRKAEKEKQEKKQAMARMLKLAVKNAKIAIIDQKKTGLCACMRVRVCTYACACVFICSYRKML